MNTVYSKLTKKQKQIFDTSVELFYNKGFKETSVRDIAEIIKIQAASLYAHISSKEQILEWIARNYVELIELELEKFSNTKRTYSEMLRFMINSNITTIHKNKKFADIFRRYIKELTPEIQSKYMDFSLAYEAQLVKVLTHFQDENHLKFEPVLAAKFLMYNMNYAHKWIPEDYSAEQIIEIFENTIVFGLIGQKLED